jgi:Bladder cancer-related protein BC10
MFCLRRYVTVTSLNFSSSSTTAIFLSIHATFPFPGVSLTTVISWVPLLFIPTNASPIFILLFFVCTYFLNRPCVYCSFLLLILFASSCHWSDHCFFDFSSTSGFFVSPPPSSSYLTSSNVSSINTGMNSLDNSTTSPVSMVEDMLVFASALNSTAATMAAAALEDAKKLRPEWTGIGVGWLRSLLGRREWRLPCLDVYVRL